MSDGRRGPGSLCNRGFEITERKIRDAYVPNVVVSCVRIDMERAESRLQVLVDEKLQNTVVHEVGRLLFLVHFD